MSDHIAEREKLLTEPIVSDILRAVAEDIGVTPEEYIDRFIEMFTEQPELFEGLIKSPVSCLRRKKH